MEGTEHKREARGETRAWAGSLGPLRRWAFALVPAVGLFELAAHLVQAHTSVGDADWAAARGYVASQVHPEDLVTFAPRWVDPIGRMKFGPELATLQREARPDETRFPRAFEVSIRGQHDPTLDGWRRADEHTFGAVTVRTLENPSPLHVLDDLVSMVAGSRMQVFRVDAGRAVDAKASPVTVECQFAHAGPQSGGLGAGPALPSDRFVCPGGGFVAATVAADLDYYPRRCIYAPPPGGRGAVRLVFHGVHVGQSLHGHHGLYVEAERHRDGPPVTLTFRAGDSIVGSVVHRDGDGWKPFEFDTSELAAKVAPAGGTTDLSADIESSTSERRMYCFEADTR